MTLNYYYTSLWGTFSAQESSPLQLVCTGIHSHFLLMSYCYSFGEDSVLTGPLAYVGQNPSASSLGLPFSTSLLTSFRVSLR